MRTVSRLVFFVFCMKKWTIDIFVLELLRSGSVIYYLLLFLSVFVARKREINPVVLTS